MKNIYMRRHGKMKNPKLGKFVLENQIENYFADKEGEYSYLIKRIIDICKNPQNKNALICRHEEKEMLAKFCDQYICEESLVTKADRVRPAA